MHVIRQHLRQICRGHATSLLDLLSSVVERLGTSFVDTKLIHQWLHLDCGACCLSSGRTFGRDSFGGWGTTRSEVCWLAACDETVQLIEHGLKILFRVHSLGVLLYDSVSDIVGVFRWCGWHDVSRSARRYVLDLG